MSRNARFWAFENDSWVKVTLKPGQTLHWHSYRQTDEGYSAEGIRWEHTGDTVTRELTYDGRDCDGRLTRHYDDHCSIDALKACVAAIQGEPEVLIPDWQAGHSSQRDYSAEAMNY